MDAAWAEPRRIVYSADDRPAAALFSAASKISRAFSMNWLTQLYRAGSRKFEGLRNIFSFFHFLLVFLPLGIYTKPSLHASVF